MQRQEEKKQHLALNRVFSNVMFSSAPGRRRDGQSYLVTVTRWLRENDECPELAELGPLKTFSRPALGMKALQLLILCPALWRFLHKIFFHSSESFFHSFTNPCSIRAYSWQFTSIIGMPCQPSSPWATIYPVFQVAYPFLNPSQVQWKSQKLSAQTRAFVRAGLSSQHA